MRAYDIIVKKRDGLELSEEEISFLIKGYTEGTIPDYQMSAWAMAVYFKGMTAKETAYLTKAIMESGDQINLAAIAGIKVDKHSTGGVGDTTTLVLVPLVAAAGVPVAKMSGRGLGHTGGTIDKLESIEGFSVELTSGEFVNNVNRVKAAIIGQSGNLTPADKKLYALRDVTGTVDSIPLIASSVMGKKLAAGADAIVLDVKVGHGAFMKNLEDATKLAEIMVQIGSELGRKTVAVITDMNQPLGKAVGNALEVKEAIEVLQGKGSPQLEELCLELGAQILILAGVQKDVVLAKKLLKELIANGSGLNKLKEIVSAQRGNPKVIDNPDLMPKAKLHVPFVSQKDGYVGAMQAELIGQAAAILGAGRETKETQIDLSVGIILQKRVGDKVSKGEPLAVIHGNNEAKIEGAKNILVKAIQVQEAKVEPLKLVHSIIF